MNAKVSLFATLSLLFAAASYADCIPLQGANLVTPGALKMSTNPTLPPLQYVDNQGQLKGMRIELGEEIARRLCLKPDYTRIEFSAMVPGLQGGRWDMINTGIFFTPARAKMMYLIPYESQAISISTQPALASNISKIEDLSGKSVGVEIGGFEENTIRKISKDLVAKNLKPIEIQTFDNFTVAFQALRAQQVSAVISIDAVAAEYQQKGMFKQVISGLEPTPVAIAFKDAKLAAATAQVLNNMNADGSLPALFKKYGAAMIPGTFSVQGPSS
ncbi:polar amino acid transport system substrate-binding protein [Erwinia toletana]|uniref:Polar amino acid transport system substrate-binding protein n=1 Tax=Winslowiella toletana TaxID=92490 RepID=A0ABS4PAB7_9GAMM|nr:ABC transporter substrate-binding protein [Winslowiella toletana]MBP2169574.1 polar amino acid transport system substrate-binding protein [Winslowiella toletana]